MVCICDIKALINSIINQRKMYIQFDTDEQRCKNYEETKKKLEEAHRLEEQYWKELAEKITYRNGEPEPLSWDWIGIDAAKSYLQREE